MKLTTSQSGSEVTIKFEGDLSGSLDNATRDKVIELIQPGRLLIIDANDLEVCSGMTLRKLLLMFRWVRSMGCHIILRGFNDHFRRCADAAGFTDLFYETPAALEASKIVHQPPPRIDIFPTLFHDQFGLRPGSPYPLGATVVTRGINFSVFSKHAIAASLVLFRFGQDEPFAEIPFPSDFRIGHIFTMIVFDLDPDEIEYGYRMSGPYDLSKGHRFDTNKVLLDPYSNCVAGFDGWGMPRQYQSTRAPYRARILPQDYDWQGDHQLELPIEDLIIYEMHVRGFTQSPSSRIMNPGTFAGIREKIPYLKQLGINCIELMPIFEFDEFENTHTNPLTGEKLCNYWGYNTIAFQAPKASFAASHSAQLQSEELKATIKELHRNGIEIILDVVFNHTAEGDEKGPTISFRGLDNETYYMIDDAGNYFNFSGCGNTLNCNHPVVREFVLNTLRHWVSEYHVDGFRFDLASILGRDENGNPLSNPPLLEALAMDPVLGKTKLIAEAWDAGGLYQVGSFPSYGRWAEWNGKYRDTLRKFLKGDANMTSEMATRLIGSPDLYAQRGPTASINFITCHDGFTLTDLVSYSQKHNLANGEDNQDGSNDNFSWNCGTEGPTSDPQILKLRNRQIKNAITMLMLSQGVPMIHMGDEFGRTQQGNNNAYCHDSPLSWLNWNLLKENDDIFRFVQLWIQFRKKHRALRHAAHVGSLSSHEPPLEVSWHGVRPWQPDWSYHSRLLAFMLRQTIPSGTDTIYAALNMFWEPLEIELPEPPTDCHWHRFTDTSLSSPLDISEVGEEKRISGNQQIIVEGRSCLVAILRSA
jgi:isoamylase